MTEYRTENKQIESAGLVYNAHFNVAYFEVRFDNCKVEIPLKRIGGFLSIFKGLGESYMIHEKIAGRFVRVTYPIDEHGGASGRIEMIQHIVDDKSYIIPEDERWTL